MLFVDLGLAVRLAGEVLRRDLLLRRRLLVVLAAHLQQIIYQLCYKLAPEKSIHLEPGCWLPLAAEMWASFTQPLREKYAFQGTQWCIILSNDLKFARESGADGEGKLVRRWNKKRAVFTHFLTQKFTTLSIP